MTIRGVSSLASGKPPFRLDQSGALPTLSMASWRPMGVGRIEGVPSKTGCLTEVSSGRPIAAAEILTDGDRLAVGRITAPAVAAEMVQAQTGWNRTHRQFVGDPMGMGHRLPSSTSVDLPVALVEGSKPRPTLVRPTAINFWPETISQRTGLGHGYMVAGSVYNGA